MGGLDFEGNILFTKSIFFYENQKVKTQKFTAPSKAGIDDHLFITFCYPPVLNGLLSTLYTIVQFK